MRRRCTFPGHGEAGLIGGVEDWTRELPRWAREPKTYTGQSEESREKAVQEAASRGAHADAIACCIGALDSALETDPRSWSEHAEHLRGLLGIVSRGGKTNSETRAVDALTGLLDQVARLESLVGDTGAVEFDRMRALLE